MAETSDIITLPAGRVINQSLFVKDRYNERATPSYKIELAFDPDELADLEEACLDFAVATWGKGADEDESLHLPILDGDKLAKKRENKGKDGSAYKGKSVIRASTHFNKYGEDDVGGIQVFGPDAEEIQATSKGDVYSGCYGILALTLSGYQKEAEDEDGDPVNVNAITFYITAFQKTDDGEKLVSSSDRSGLFKPVAGRAEKKGKDEGRKKRKG